MGRPADPTRARRKTGNRPLPGQAKPAKTSPVTELAITGAPAEPALPPPPPELPEAAHELWNRVLEELAPRGLREADLDAVRMLCVAALRHRQASAEIDRLGILVKGKSGPIVNPLLKVERDQVATYMRIANDYGLTISSRLRLGLIQLAGQSILQSLNDDLDLALTQLKR